jgi:hypothetical protein
VIPGVDTPIVPIPKRPSWSDAMSPEELEASENRKFAGAS